MSCDLLFAVLSPDYIRGYPVLAVAFGVLIEVELARQADTFVASLRFCRDSFVRGYVLLLVFVFFLFPE